MCGRMRGGNSVFLQRMFSVFMNYCEEYEQLKAFIRELLINCHLQSLPLRFATVFFRAVWPWSLPKHCNSKIIKLCVMALAVVY
jgi:hypothetical protein